VVVSTAARGAALSWCTLSRCTRGGALSKRGHYEIYDGSKGRYVTITGHRLPGATEDIVTADPDALSAAYSLMMPTAKQRPSQSSPTLDEGPGLNATARSSLLRRTKAGVKEDQKRHDTLVALMMAAWHKGATQADLETLAENYPHSKELHERDVNEVPRIIEWVMQTPRELPERQSICVTGQYLREITQASLEAVQKANIPEPFLFQRGSELVRANHHGIERLGHPGLKGVLDRVADYYKLSASGDTIPARPPNDVAADILSLDRESLPFPPLEATANAPVFVRGGRLLDRNGYDQETGIIVQLDHLGTVRSDMDVGAALELLEMELLGDFPFDTQASKTNALALLLEPFVRPLIPVAPLHLLEAPSRGTGKGLLANVVSIVVTGGEAEVMSLTRDTDELEKRITSVLFC